MDIRTRHKLSHAATEFDRKQSTRKGYNPYALSHYLGAVQNIESAVDDDGQDLRDAILNFTSGHLASVLLRAVGLAPMTKDEARS